MQNNSKDTAKTFDRNYIQTKYRKTKAIIEVGYRNMVETLFFANVVLVALLPIFLLSHYYKIHILSIILIGLNFYLYKSRVIEFRYLSNFKRISATIKDIEIEKYIFGRSSGNKFCPQIEYEYTVNEKTYQSDKVFFDSSYCKESYEECEDFLIDIVKNGLYIYYDPTNPFEAYVFNEYNLKNKIYLNGLIVCSGLLFLGIVYSCVWILV